jgi:hypothetical protein
MKRCSVHISRRAIARRPCRYAVSPPVYPRRSIRPVILGSGWARMSLADPSVLPPSLAIGRVTGVSDKYARLTIVPHTSAWTLSPAQLGRVLILRCCAGNADDHRGYPPQQLTLRHYQKGCGGRPAVGAPIDRWASHRRMLRDGRRLQRRASVESPPLMTKVV